MDTPIKFNHVSVIVAAAAAFVVSAIYYMLLGNALLEIQVTDPNTASQEMPAWKIAGEFIRSLVLAYVLFYFASVLHISAYSKALALSVVVWVGFPLILFTGSVMHENVDWQIAAIHSGDWFVKPLVILLVITFFNRKKITKNERIKNSNLAS